MRSKLIGIFLGLLILTSFSVCQASAAEFSVTMKNLTHGTWFTPLLITAHDRHTDLFETGKRASGALQAMAEGGDISGLLAYAKTEGPTASPIRPAVCSPLEQRSLMSFSMPTAAATVTCHLWRCCCPPTTVS
jgi:hypothetical protein